MASYYGLCSWLDHNVGEILTILEETGFGENTTIVYSSDHGDNAGARGLWGKSNMYEESAAIPLIISGPDVPAGKSCDTPVSLLDVSATIADHFGATLEDTVGTSLYEIAAAPCDKERVVLSEYHAVGSVSGAFMIVKGDYKLIHYTGFEPELFDLKRDPEELVDLAKVPAFRDILRMMQNELSGICNPEKMNELAHADQRALVESVGGLEVALTMGPKGATPPPGVT